MLPPDLSPTPIAALIDTLKTCGYDVPEGLPEAIVQRAGDALEPLYALLRDDALWESGEPRGFMAVIYALHLLGGIGDAAALPVLLEVVKTRDLGDFLTEGIPSILAALVPPVVEPLVAAAAEGSLDSYQRHALASGLYGIAARHPEHRAEVSALFVRLLGDPDEELVTILIESAARIDDAGVQAGIDAAFAEGRVDGIFIDPSDVERIRSEPRWAIPRELEDPMNYFRAGRLAWTKQEREMVPRPEAVRVLQAARALPVRKAPKVGRNEPCPCGSGKKYKKCCLP